MESWIGLVVVMAYGSFFSVKSLILNLARLILYSRRTTPVSKAKSKPGPRSAKANKTASPSSPPTTSKKRKKSNLNGDREEDDQQSLLDDIGSDEEEAFSSVGPYQCEICQVKVGI